MPEVGERVGGVMDQKVANEKLQKAVQELGEYFDAVQIFATWGEDGDTMKADVGCGNWYAREGMVAEWVQSNEARVWVHESKVS